MQNKTFPDGQAVDSSRHIYICRDMDQSLADMVSCSEWGAITGCRTMGKTSLATMFIHKAVDGGDIAAGYIDVSTLKNSSSLDDWICKFEIKVKDAFGVAIDLPQVSESFDRILNLFSNLVEKTQVPTVLFLDEVDYLR